MKRVTPTKRLRVNPDLVIWPGDTVASFLLDDGGSRPATTPFVLPEAAITVLHRFLRPRRARDVFRTHGPDVIALVRQSLVERLLLASGRRHTRGQSARWAGFRFHDHSSMVHPNIRRVVTRRHVIDGRFIVVADRILPRRWIEAIHRWFFQLAFRRVDVDTRRTAHIRHWAREFRPATRFVEAVPAFAALMATAHGLARKRSLVLDRLQAYGTTYGDLPLPHRDREHGRGVTAVYYGNAHWDDGWASETVFYNRRGEATIVVPPRPGRMVVFDSSILHRAGSPDRECHETRFTLVFRFSLS